MTRAELIAALAIKLPHISIRDIEQAVKLTLEQMACALKDGKRIEIRGFGSFTLRYRPPRSARNPKTGENVVTEGKFAVYFKPGKELRNRVNESLVSLQGEKIHEE